MIRDGVFAAVALFLLTAPVLAGGTCDDSLGFCAPIPCPAADSCSGDSDCGTGFRCEPYDSPDDPCVPSECNCSPEGWNCSDDCAPHCVAVAPEVVPTASEWGLVHLSLLLLSGGALLFRVRLRSTSTSGSGLDLTVSGATRWPRLGSFSRILAATVGLCAAGLSAATLLGYRPDAVDVQGSLVTAVLVAFIVAVTMRSSPD